MITAYNSGDCGHRGPDLGSYPALVRSVRDPTHCNFHYGGAPP